MVEVSTLAKFAKHFFLILRFHTSMHYCESFGVLQLFQQLCLETTP